MRYLFALILLACAAVAGGCILLVPRINYDLTASVAGLVDRENIREVVGDHLTDAHESFWDSFGNDLHQLLRVRLSTSKDLVAFADSKSVWLHAVWYFCSDPEQEVYLGENSLFVDGGEVPSISRRPSPVIADGLGRFSYDAVLYVRGWLMSDETREIEGYFDLVREPRDVCVRVWLPTKMGGYKTNAARISKEEIAAALGVEISSDHAACIPDQCCTDSERRDRRCARRRRRWHHRGRPRQARR